MLAGDNGILTKVVEAKEKTNKAGLKEQIELAIIDSYTTSGELDIDKLKNNLQNEGMQVEGKNFPLSVSVDEQLYVISKNGQVTNDKWIDNGNGTFTSGDITVKIGDTVNYSVTGYSGDWCVLGVEDGQLLLISKNGAETMNLSGKDGYLNGISRLNDTCAKYADGTIMTKARSVNIEDIDKITGYDKNTSRTNKVSEYNNTVTYSIKDGVVVYNSTNESTGTSSYTSFEDVNGNKLGEDIDEISVLNNWYFYYPTTLTESSTDVEKGLSTDSAEYKTLFLNSSGSTYTYWLASSNAWAQSGVTTWGICIVWNGKVNYNTGYLWNSSAGSRGYTYNVRPVCYLSPNYNLKEGTSKTWDIDV